jgi:hypothetical protein
VGQRHANRWCEQAGLIVSFPLSPSNFSSTLNPGVAFSTAIFSAAEQPRRRAGVWLPLRLVRRVPLPEPRGERSPADRGRSSRGSPHSSAASASTYLGTTNDVASRVTG